MLIRHTRAMAFSKAEMEKFRARREDREEQRRRNDNIVALYFDMEWTYARIAKAMGLTSRQVGQIIREYAKATRRRWKAEGEWVDRLEDQVSDYEIDEERFC
jgi:CRISPR/Cas system CSM-associated protein Csm2 small subunit